MKKIIAILIAVCCANFGAEARTVKNACGSTSNKVCRKTANGKSCYKTHYAENFKVCRNNHGYFICCEVPRSNNSTHSGYYVTDETTVAILPENNTMRTQTDNAVADNNTVNGVPTDLIAPQSQSYPSTSQVYAINNGISYENSGSYEGYYPTRKGRIKVCYYGNNVAEDNRMPYQGCPSPQYDGPEKNAQRNMNVTTPSDLPPINGWGSQR